MNWLNILNIQILILLTIKSKDKHAYVVLENFHFFHWKSMGNF